MFVLIFLCCVGRGLCDGLITHPKESYRVSKYITKPVVCEEDKVLARTVEPPMNAIYSTLLTLYIILSIER
jgi:hypothetical protein